MATYILLLTLTAEGRAQMARDPEMLARAEEQSSTGDVQTLGSYGVLGEYDFVTIVEAPDNAAAAEFSLRLGVQAGAHITTLPAVPIARFEERRPQPAGEERTGRAMDVPRARNS